MLPDGANSFLIELTLYRKGLICSSANRKSQKLSPLEDMAKYLPAISSSLNSIKIARPLEGNCWSRHDGLCLICIWYIKNVLFNSIKHHKSHIILYYH